MSTIDSVKVTDNGIIEIRILKSDGGWHRTTVEPGTDVDAQMATVNKHLKALGVAQCSEFAVLKDRARVAHTPAVVAAFKEKQNKSA